MWYLNSTNTEEITAAQVKENDIITYTTEPGHGSYITYTGNGRRTGTRDIRSHGSRRVIDGDRKVWRLRKEDGKVVRATRDANGV